jgi:DMSO reductase anchor subunit
VAALIVWFPFVSSEGLTDVYDSSVAALVVLLVAVIPCVFHHNKKMTWIHGVCIVIFFIIVVITGFNSLSLLKAMAVGGGFAVLQSWLLYVVDDPRFRQDVVTRLRRHVDDRCIGFLPLLLLKFCE